MQSTLLSRSVLSKGNVPNVAITQRRLTLALCAERSPQTRPSVRIRGRARFLICVGVLAVFSTMAYGGDTCSVSADSPNYPVLVTYTLSGSGIATANIIYGGPSGGCNGSA